MTITVSFGVTRDNLTISSGDPLVVLSGGRVGEVTILSGGSATMSLGALGGNMTVSSGGALLGPGRLGGENIDDGLISGASLQTGGDIVVSAGGIAEDVTANDDYPTTIYVSSGGTASYSHVGSGGQDFVYSGGASIDDIIGSSGTLGLYGGTVTGTAILSGGEVQLAADLTSDFTLTSGPVTSLTTLEGATLQSGAQAVLDGATVVSGVTLSLASGAIADNITVAKGGVARGPGELADQSYVAGAAIGVTVGDDRDNPSSYLEILSGGTASDVTAVDLSTIQVEAGGTALGASLSAAYLDVAGSAADTRVGAGSVERISSGGSATGDVVQSAGLEIVASGGVASGTTVSGGGQASIDGVADDATIQSGGVAYISSGGLASGTTVLRGGAQVLVSGGAGRSATLSGGKDDVDSGGVASGTTVLSGGVEYVSSGGVASGAVVRNAGQEIVRTGGVARGVTVSTGGVEYLSSGGAASATRVLSGGADAVLASGRASGTLVSAGGREVVSAGGVASATTVLSGGTEYVRASGTAYGLAVAAGGAAYVDSGGVAAAASVSSGADMVISSGGAANGLALSSGAQLTDDGAVVISGAGTLAGVLLGSGKIAETGGGDLVLSGDGAKFAGGAVISGGTIELATANALGGGYVEFEHPATGSAVLQIDAADAPTPGGTFANVISNFDSAGEDIDLRSIAYVSGASATVVGSTLVLTDGGKTYKFEIAGGAAGAYPVLSDGHGGTLIDPEVTRFAHSLAAFAPSDAAKTALVPSASPAAQTPFVHAAVSATAGHA